MGIAWPRVPTSGIGGTRTPLQRRLFAQVEAAARRAGHGAVLDAWGEDLDLMRPQEG
ncbi:hypothetical protein [Nonomuraea angiospora]